MILPRCKLLTAFDSNLIDLRYGKFSFIDQPDVSLSLFMKEEHDFEISLNDTSHTNLASMITVNHRDTNQGILITGFMNRAL